jgi:hypothetical protein
MPTTFRAVNTSTYDELKTYDGAPFQTLAGKSLVDAALDFGVRDPALLSEEPSLKMLIAALAVANGALDGNGARGGAARGAGRARPYRARRASASAAPGGPAASPRARARPRRRPRATPLPLGAPQPTR